MVFIDREGIPHGLIPLTVGVTLVVVLLGLLAGRAVVLRLPPDVLEATPSPLSRTRAVVRAVAGAVLVATGIALLVLPGPGVLVIALGVLMLLPSRRSQLVRAIVSRPRALREINAFRRRHGRAEIGSGQNKPPRCSVPPSPRSTGA